MYLSVMVATWSPHVSLSYGHHMYLSVMVTTCISQLWWLLGHHTYLSVMVTTCISQVMVTTCISQLWSPHVSLKLWSPHVSLSYGGHPWLLCFSCHMLGHVTDHVVCHVCICRGGIPPAATLPLGPGYGHTDSGGHC